MSRGINKVTILGRLGQDPEVRATADGTVVTTLNVATSYKGKGKDEAVTEWHRIVLFGKLAEVAEKFLKKGSQTYFEGRLQTRKWQDKEGNDRWSTEVVAHHLELLGDNTGTNSRSQSSTAPADYPKESSPSPSSAAPPDDGFDDIPF